MAIARDDALDPRIRRTRKFLRDGLRKVLAEKPLEEILVQDITEAATVNRATFYDHYADKHDLFNALIAEDFEEMLGQRNVCFEGRDCAIVLETIVLTVGDFLERIHRNHAACSRQAAAGPMIDAALTLAVRRLVLDGMQKHAEGSPRIPHEVAASMVSGSLYGAVKESMAKADWRVDEDALRSLVPVIQSLYDQTAGCSTGH